MDGLSCARQTFHRSTLKYMHIITSYKTTFEIEIAQNLIGKIDVIIYGVIPINIANVEAL